MLRDLLNRWKQIVKQRLNYAKVQEKLCALEICQEQCDYWSVQFGCIRSVLSQWNLLSMSSCDCLQDPGADRELREIRMRYTRERDMRNENLRHDAEDLAFLPHSIRNILARTFGPRHAQSIFWLLFLIIVFVMIRLLFGSPLAYMGRLPTDIRLKGSNWQFYAPVGTCILLSILFSAFSRLLGPIFARPARYSQDHGQNIPPARGGVQFHGSIVVCAVQ